MKSFSGCLYVISAFFALFGFGVLLIKKSSVDVLASSLGKTAEVDRIMTYGPASTPFFVISLLFAVFATAALIVHYYNDYCGDNYNYQREIMLKLDELIKTRK